MGELVATKTYVSCNHSVYTAAVQQPSPRDLFFWVWVRRAALLVFRQSIARRARGMMAASNNTETVAGINSLYHALTVEEPGKCQAGGVLPRVDCDAQGLADFHFTEPNCDASTALGEDVQPLSLTQTGALFIILIMVAMFGASMAECGQHHTNNPVVKFFVSNTLLLHPRRPPPLGPQPLRHY